MVLDDSIGRRLAFLKDEYNRGLPPVASTRKNNMPTAAPRRLDLSRHRGPSFLQTSTIAATKKQRAIMRSVSGLGMEDPVFGTTEDGPQHPSNIFDDMSLGDLPEDLRDMISVASDPTADLGDGVDMNVFHSSLGELNSSIEDLHASFSELHASAPTGLMVDYAPTTPKTPKADNVTKMEEDEGSMSETMFGPDSIEIRATAQTQTKKQPSPGPSQANRLKRSDALTTRKTSQTAPVPPKPSVPSVKLLEKLNASIQSLPPLSFEDTMDGIPSILETSQREEDDLHKSFTSFVSATSKTSKSTQSEMAEEAKQIPRGHNKKQSAIQQAQARKESQTMFQVFVREKKKDMQKFLPPSTPKTPYGSSSKVRRGDSIYQPVQKSDFDPSALPAGLPLSNDGNTPAVDFQPSGLHRPDGRYQALPNLYTVERKRSSLNSSLLVAQPDNLHIPPTQPGISVGEPVTKSRTLPNIANLFPMDAAVRSKRMRSRRAKVPVVGRQIKSSPATSSDNVSDITPVSAMMDYRPPKGAQSDQAVRSSRNTNSRSSAYR